MTTTTNLYPTIADKVQLFRENGIDATDRFRGKEDDCPVQVMRFPGDRSIADLAVAVVKSNSLEIIALNLAQNYDGDHPIGEPYWLMYFRPLEVV